jgi:hypothetical protein
LDNDRNLLINKYLVDKECPVCYETFDKMNLSITSCFHIFCSHCVVALNRKGDNTCPMCRSSLKWKYIGQLEQSDKYVMDSPEHCSKLKIENIFEKIIEPKSTDLVFMSTAPVTRIQPTVVVTSRASQHIRF